MAKAENTKASNPDAVEEKQVPVKLLISEAGYGYRIGEIRGFPESIAKKMIEKGHAEPVAAPSKKAE